MKDRKRKLFRFFLMVTGVSIILTVLVILFISPITKYLVEKYDEKYTGRQITMDRAYVNPFTGYIHFKNLKIFELEKDSVFFSTDGIGVNIAILKLFSKTYEISECSLDHPRGTIIQNKKEFNFSDLIEKFSSKDTLKKKEPIHLNILNIKINDGVFYYREKLIPINYFIKNVNIESHGFRTDTDSIVAKFSFLSGIGSGDIKGDFAMDVKKLDYRMSVLVHKFDLNIIGQYLKDLTNYGTFAAKLDADIKSYGNFKDEQDVTTSGHIEISDFHFGKNTKDDYLSFEKLVLAIHELSPKKHVYFYDSISLNHPYFKYERYDHLDNIQTMFGKNGGNLNGVNGEGAQFNLVVEIANYIKELSKNFLKSDYKINRLAVYDGNVIFNDYSINEKFSIELDPLYLNADSVEKNNKRVSAILRSGIKPYGDLIVNLSINPHDSSDFDLQFQFRNISIPTFNPYIITYTSFPLDRGTIELKGNWKVRNGNISSDNHLLIIDPRLTRRITNNNVKRIPMRLIMPFIRERGNVIDYEIPITGNLKDPKFHIKDVLLDLVENLFVKPATTPYRVEVKYEETKIEKSLTLKWEMRQTSLRDNQSRFVKKIAKFLSENPEASISVAPQNYSLKEKEYILFYESKKIYFLTMNKRNTQSFTEEDAERVENMSIKDSLFVHYINSRVNNNLVFTLQEKCTRLMGLDTINFMFKKLNSERMKAFMEYFKEKGVEKQIKIYEGIDVIPYNGFSFYKIEYKDVFPESLIKANEVMNQLNTESPRKKFFKRRKKIIKDS